MLNCFLQDFTPFHFFSILILIDIQIIKTLSLMAYRNKFYACFDGDNDIIYYRLLTAWNENDNIEFSFNDAHALSQARDSSSEETIKRSLKERLKNSKALVVLVGKNTKNLYKFVRWEIEQAIGMDLPIIVVNLNKKRYMDEELCSPILKNALAVHISFEQKIIGFAMTDWLISLQAHKRNAHNGPVYYFDSVYKNLGL